MEDLRRRHALPHTGKSFREAADINFGSLMDLRYVNGVGVSVRVVEDGKNGPSKHCVLLVSLIREPTQEEIDTMPQELEGVPVEYEFNGTPFAARKEPKAPVSPLPTT